MRRLRQMLLVSTSSYPFMFPKVSDYDDEETAIQSQASASGARAPEPGAKRASPANLSLGSKQ